MHVAQRTFLVFEIVGIILDKSELIHECEAQLKPLIKAYFKQPFLKQPTRTAQRRSSNHLSLLGSEILQRTNFLGVGNPCRLLSLGARVASAPSPFELTRLGLLQKKAFSAVGA